MSKLPERKFIGNTEYVLTLFRVDSIFDNQPETFRVIRDTQTCELSENPEENQFYTAYIPRSLHDKINKKQN